MGQKKDQFTYYLSDNKGGVFKTNAKSIEEAKARRTLNLPTGGCLIPMVLFLLVIGILL